LLKKIANRNGAPNPEEAIIFAKQDKRWRHVTTATFLKYSEFNLNLSKLSNKITHHVRVILIGFGMLLSSCATSIGKLPVYTGESGTPSLSEHEKKVVCIQYLGVGGYVFRYGKNVLMTAPSITNPGLLKIVSMTRLKTNEALVDKVVPPVEDGQMILVGHTHYDHLLDVPYIMKNYAKKAVVYGSGNMEHIMAPAIDKSRIVTVNKYAAKGRVPGQWVYNQDRTIRFMAIESEHAPHFAGMKFLPKGHYK
jgi:hypothetical protein